MTEVPERKDVFHLIGKVCGRNFRRMHEMLDALGLYHGQPPVLDALWQQDGMTQSELADKLNRSPSTITKTVQRMEKAGFVERCHDPKDERISRVYLTSAGYTSAVAKISIAELLKGPSAYMFWVGLVFLGLIVPAVISVISIFSGEEVSHILLIIAIAAHTLGAFALKYCLLKVGIYRPLLPKIAAY